MAHQGPWRVGAGCRASLTNLALPLQPATKSSHFSQLLEWNSPGTACFNVLLFCCDKNLEGEWSMANWGRQFHHLNRRSDRVLED